MERRIMTSMLEYLESFPEQCATAVKMAREFPLDRRKYRAIKQVVVLGMGGSAAGGDLLKTYVNREAGVPFEVVRDYSLPGYVGKDTLVFAVSYSGNTEETLSAYKEALCRSAKIIAITSGGRLKKLCNDDGIQVLEIPQGMPPRATLGYLFFPTLVFLQRLNLVKPNNGEIKETIHNLGSLCANYSPESKHNLARDLAEKINGYLALVYTANYLAPCALRWKNQFNENSKSLSFFSVFPEMNHNEIEAWKDETEITRKCYLIFLRDNEENERIKQRIAITEGILKDKVAGIQHIASTGNSFLSRLFSLVYLGDWVSTYLALMNSIDPVPTPLIALLKEKLSK